ncbi:MAG: ABC transporter ATP-binding protein [Elusimicrobia bacterium]|nr:ABC transporter ATP-binding protein [Elusimicrobiota bacterium]
MHGHADYPFEEEEEGSGRIRYRRTFRRLAGLLRGRWKEIVVASLFLAVASAANLAGPVILRHAIDVDLAARNAPGLLRTLGVFFLATAASGVFTYLLRVALETLGQDILFELKKRIFSHLLSLGLGYFDKTPVGRITARVEADTGELRGLFADTAVLIFRDVGMFVGMFAVMASVHAGLTLVMAALLPPVIAASIVFVRKSAAPFVSVRRLTAEISATLTERIQGMAVIQAYNRQQDSACVLASLNKRKFDVNFRAEAMAVYFFVSVLALEPVAMALILGLGGRWALQGTVTIGTLVMFILYVEQVFEPIFHITEHLGTIQRSFAAGARIFDLLDTQRSIADPPMPRFLGRIEHAVEFRGVSLRYSEDAPWALRDVSFAVPKGSRLALVGETGGGKTSIVSLLFKFYLPQEGDILIDGVSISCMSQAGLRQLMGLVQQDIYLFPGTVMDNLKLMDRRVPDCRVHDAIRTLGLEAVCRRIALDREVIERGANLSTGEKQVLSLVRAMVLDPDLLVLDEATSSVDPHTERTIQAAMERLMTDRTSIVVAHRLSTVRNAHRILVVRQGRVAESGAHAELMRKGGVYSKLFRLQFSDS